MFRISDLVLRVLFVLFSFFICNAYALDIDSVKAHFLEGDYKAAIQEGEKILAIRSQFARLDELYYILGLSYLKDGNLLRASDIFEIIIKEFRDSRYKEEARLGLGDIYSLKGDFPKAEEYYNGVLSMNPETKLKAQVYSRLSQLEFKKGNIQAGKEYRDKLAQEFPSSLEAQGNKDACPVSGNLSGFYYTVQIGSFSNRTNAYALVQKLLQGGYQAYVEEYFSQSAGKVFRVRVGKLSVRLEAVALEEKLSQEGYPTKICP